MEELNGGEEWLWTDGDKKTCEPVRASEDQF